MKVYLSAQYKQKTEMRGYADKLREHGHEIVSTWLREAHDPNCSMQEVSEDELRELAETDLNEVRRCEVMLFFSLSEMDVSRRGGRHVEFGYALAHDKRLIVVGPKENIFHYLTDVEIVPDIDTAIRALGLATKQPSSCIPLPQSLPEPFAAVPGD